MCRSYAPYRHDRNFGGRPGDDSLPFLAVGPGSGLCGVDREADARIAENAVAHVAHDGPSARPASEPHDGSSTPGLDPCRLDHADNALGRMTVVEQNGRADGVLLTTFPGLAGNVQFARHWTEERRVGKR